MAGTPQQAISNVGRRVAELRKKKGWTQEQMAERLDVATPYLARVEGGKENLTIRSLHSIAGVLGVSLIRLFEKPTTKKPRPGRPPGKPVQRKVR